MIFLTLFSIGLIGILLLVYLNPIPDPIVDVFPACREVIVTVLQGDTLDSISMNYAVSKDYIKQYNRLETDEVLPSMTLLIQMCSNMPTPTVTPTK